MDFELPGDDDPRRLEIRAWFEAHPRPTGRHLAEAGLATVECLEEERAFGESLGVDDARRGAGEHGALRIRGVPYAALSLFESDGQGRAEHD